MGAKSFIGTPRMRNEGVLKNWYGLCERHTPILKSAMGRHGNHAFSHSPYQFFLGHLRFLFRGGGGVPMNNLAPMKNCPGGFDS